MAEWPRLLTPPCVPSGRSQKEIQAYCTEAVAFMEKKAGQGNIFSAVIHMDEKTPHLHLCFTPVTEDGRLSAKEILDSRMQPSQWQDEFHTHMKKAFPGRKRDKVLELVGPCFSRLEKHLGQMKKYQATIDYLTQENEGLRERVNDEKRIQRQMEVLMLKRLEQC